MRQKVLGHYIAEESVAVILSLNLLNYHLCKDMSNADLYQILFIPFSL